MLYPTELHALLLFNFFKEILINLNLANLVVECIKKIFLNKLKIKNFRNHKSFGIDLKEKRTIVLGCNGIGKSNLLESIELRIQPIQVNLTCQYRCSQEQLLFALLNQFQNFYGSENF